MLRGLLVLQCLALLVLSVLSLPVEETAKNTGDTVETVDITPTKDKLPETGDTTDLDELDKILADTSPDRLPEFDETAKNPGDTLDTVDTVDTIEVTPIEDKLPETGDAEDDAPKTGESTDLDDVDKIIPDTVPDDLPEFDEKTPGDTVDTVKITPTEDKLPETGAAEDNAPKTGQSLGDLDQLIPEILPDLPDLPKVPDLIPECKKENETCSGFPACCGDFKCYWETGLSFVKKGVCVSCVAEGLSCFRSGQCCGNNDDDDKDPDAIICDKGTNPFEDGSCAPKRTSGKCYKDKQCMGHKCDKKWYRLTGNCVPQVQ